MQVEAFGPFGARLTEPEIHLYPLDRSRDLASGARRGLIERVPFGQYILVVISSGGGIATRQLAVNSVSTQVVIGVPIATGERLWPAGDLTLRIRLPVAAGHAAGWWARAVGVYLNTTKEAVLREGGMFEITGLDTGAYVVEVFERNRLRYIQEVEIDSNRQVTDVNLLRVERSRPR